MTTLFEISPSSIDAESCSLICELSTEGFSYAIKNDEENSFLGVAVSQFDKSKPQAGFPIALQILFHQHKLLSKNFKKRFIFYSLPESVLIPFSLYDSTQNSNVLNLIHGDLPNQSTILADVITGHNLYNNYRVPTPVYNAIQNQFGNIISAHQYSALLKQEAPEKNKLFVIFYTQKIVVSLFKDGKFQLINSFNYRIAEDVSYTLLNICQQFEMDNIDLEISGLIEENSALHKEIYKYFANIIFAGYGKDCNFPKEISNYPSHYFSHIFALDSCE